MFLDGFYVAAGTYYHIATTFLPFQLKILFGSSGFVYVVLFHEIKTYTNDEDILKFMFIKKDSISLTVSDIWTSLHKLHYNCLIGTLFSRYQPLHISYWLTTNLITNYLLRKNKKTESSTILSADREHTDSGPLSPRQTLF